MAKTIVLKNIVWKEGKHYVAQCLNVDVSSFGSTKLKALAALNEALELYFEETKRPSALKIERPEIIAATLRYA
jgi:predicted RNase H-like HicB family nuclease